MLEFLLERAFLDPTCYSEEKECTAFHIPAVRAHIEIIELLMDPRFTGNFNDGSSGLDDLCYCFLDAISENQIDVAMRMLDRWPHDIDVNFENGAALRDAAGNGALTLVRQLLDEYPELHDGIGTDHFPA